MFDDFWRDHWGLSENGLGAPVVVAMDSRETIATFRPEEWHGHVWESMEGARVTTADAPERFATIARVEHETRSLIFTGEASVIQPGRGLYFFNPDRKPEALHG